MAGKNPSIITPFRYAMVEEGLYRGAYPTTRNYRFLKRLKLKTMLSLIPSKPIDELTNFCKEQGIKNIYFNVEKFKDDSGQVTIKPTLVAEILRIILDPSNFPVFIHCLDGAHNTGLVIMCLRKLQNWTLSFIFSEFMRFTRGQQIYSSESEYIEVFNEEISIPLEIPSWLWQGQRLSKHPTIKIKLDTQGSSEINQEKKKTTKKVEHAFWKDPSDNENLSRNLRALNLDGGIFN